MVLKQYFLSREAHKFRSSSTELVNIAEKMENEVKYGNGALTAIKLH